MATFEKGLYQVTVTGQGFGELENAKKTQYFFLEFTVVGKIDPNSDTNLLPAPQGGGNVKLWLSKKGIKMTVGRLRDLGWLGDKFTELEPGGSHSFIGQNLDLNCDPTQNGDRVYDQWDFPMFGNKESQGGIASKLDNLYGRALRDSAKAVKPASEPAPVQENTPTGPPEEDIPF